MPPETLDELDRAVARDLEMVAHPRKAWLAPRFRGGAPVLDVLVVGAGQCGLAAGFALRRDRVERLLLIDRAPAGQEGPWLTYARMPTLRSPKDQTGPDLNIPSLTYQSWHEARWGAADFAAMRLIPAGHWQEYLDWFRRVTQLPVRNGVALAGVAPDACDEGTPCIAARLDSGEVLFARKLVLATGQDGTGSWWMPDFLTRLPVERRAHSADTIDFTALRGRVVAVLGAGASAFDNAATALEAGAAEVHLFCRRAEPQTVQPFRWLTFAGFLKHIGEMEDEWRWRFMAHIMGLREGFPADTYARVERHANFTLHAGQGWTGAAMDGDAILLETACGPFRADFVIAGTGVEHDCRLRPELAGFASNVATWADRYTPPVEERDARLGRFPYLSADYAFTEKVPGLTPWIGDIHLFGIGATMSFGPSGSSINAMATAAPKLAAGVTRGLFRADLRRNWAELRAYNEKQVEI
jgi:cation diffusion facilitator CzcD-associated flavoprotein CzcO